MASKRTRRSLLLALVALVLVLAGLGLAVATPPGVPATFSVPLPKVGDRFEYTVTIVRGMGEDAAIVQEESLLGSFIWEEPRTILDAQGHYHRVNQLRTFPFGTDAEGRRVQVAGSIFAFDVESGSMVLETRVDGDEDDAMVRHKTFLHNKEDQHIVLCGIQNRLQGRQVSLRGEVDLFRPCSYEDYWSPYGGGFQAMAAQRLAGQDTILFSRGLHLFPSHEVHAWFSAGLPYPVRLTVQDQDEPELFHVMRLSSFTPGDKPIETAAPGLPRDVEVPVVETSPADRMGPDDASLATGWPLREAWQTASEHPDAADLRAFLDEHPDWVVGQAGLSHSHAGQTTSSFWSFWVGDGPDWFVFSIDRHTGPRQATVDVLGQPVPVPGEQPVQTWYVYNHEGNPEPGPGTAHIRFPDETQLPDLPDLASIEQRWRMYADPSYHGRAANTWSFRYVCREDACTSVAIDVAVGHSDRTGLATTGSIYGVDNWFGPWEATLDEYHPPDRAPDGLRPMDAQDVAVEGMPLAVTVWSFPPGYVMWAGALALLGTALYGLYPKLVAPGALALFSRIESQALLQHPMRRAIHQAVEANPGIHANELMRLLGQPRGTVDHHVRKLVRGGLLTVKAANGYRCLFLAGAAGRAQQDAAAFVRAPGARRLLQEIVRRPGRGLRDVARAARLSPASASYHVGRMEKAGLVALLRREAGLGVLPTDLGVRVAA